MNLVKGSHPGQLRATGYEQGSAGLRERYPAVPASVRRGRHAIVDFAVAAGAVDEQLDAIALAASEALTNAVMHAYRQTDGLIHVGAWVASEELWLLIADDGCGLRPGRKGPGLGQGLALISLVTDSLAIHDRSSGGTELRMRFDLKPGGGQSRGSVSSATLPASPRFSTTR